MEYYDDERSRYYMKFIPKKIHDNLELYSIFYL